MTGRRRERGGEPLELRLLGGFGMRSAGQPVNVPLALQRLLALLALSERPRHRREVAASLWPDANEQRASGNLRATLWRLPRPRGDIVVSSGATVALAPTVVVDHRAAVEEARRLIRMDMDMGDRQLDLQLLDGDLLPAWSDEWVVVERERLRQLRLHALETLCIRLARAGRGACAVAIGQMVVTADPLRESARRALIIAYLLAGNTGEALEQYSSYSTLVNDELGARPSRLLYDLVAGIRPDERRLADRPVPEKGGSSLSAPAGLVSE